VLQLSSNIASKLNCSCRLSVICAESENSFFCLEFIPVILKWLPNKIQSETWRGFLKTWRKTKQWSETKGNHIQCVSIFVHLSALDRWPFELSVHRRPNKNGNCLDTMILFYLFAQPIWSCTSCGHWLLQRQPMGEVLLLKSFTRNGPWFPTSRLPQTNQVHPGPICFEDHGMIADYSIIWIPCRKHRKLAFASRISGVH